MIYLLLIIVLHMILFILIAKFYGYLQKNSNIKREETIEKTKVEETNIFIVSEKSRPFIDITFSSN